jgi:hypothetical protein
MVEGRKLSIVRWEELILSAVRVPHIMYKATEYVEIV